MIHEYHCAYDIGDNWFCLTCKDGGPAPVMAAIAMASFHNWQHRHFADDLKVAQWR